MQFAIGATLLSVTGQLLVKKASGTPFQIACGIAISAGLLGLIGLLAGAANTGAFHFEPLVISAGAIFFVANLLWIYAMQKSSNISLVRAVMAGLEIALLAVLAFYIYKQTLTKKQIIGIFLVTAGIAAILV